MNSRTAFPILIIFFLLKINNCFCMDSNQGSTSSLFTSTNSDKTVLSSSSLNSLATSPSSSSSTSSANLANLSSSVLSSSSLSSLAVSSSSSSNKVNNLSNLNLEANKINKKVQELFLESNRQDFEKDLSELTELFRKYYISKSGTDDKNQKEQILIERDLEKVLKDVLNQARVIGIFGARQSGKTFLAKSVFKDHTYISLEDFDSKRFAEQDPRGFLASFDNSKGVIIDEIQNVPELVSYIKSKVDEKYRPGFFVLVGSQSFLLNQNIKESLAGRIYLYTLLPFSMAELEKMSDFAKDKFLPKQLDNLMYQGFYPVIYSQNNDHHWYNYYINTYLEKDVRTITRVMDLSSFQKFLKACAGHIGQRLNMASLGRDCGISPNTIKSWLSILEKTYVIFLLNPFNESFGKRLGKTSKLYFYDIGLACTLLDIENGKSLSTYYLRGNLFKSMIISEILKMFNNNNGIFSIYFWRDAEEHEIDCIIKKGFNLYPIVIKAGMTINSDFFKELEYWNKLTKNESKNGFVIYAGEEFQERSAGNVVSWKKLNELFKRI